MQLWVMKKQQQHAAIMICINYEYQMANKSRKYLHKTRCVAQTHTHTRIQKARWNNKNFLAKLMTSSSAECATSGTFHLHKILQIFVYVKIILYALHAVIFGKRPAGIANKISENKRAKKRKIMNKFKSWLVKNKQIFSKSTYIPDTFYSYIHIYDTPHSCQLLIHNKLSIYSFFIFGNSLFFVFAVFVCFHTHPSIFGNYHICICCM